MSHPPPAVRADDCWFCAITTRRMDNDVYGPVNNGTYYAWIDSFRRSARAFHPYPNIN
jgi:hypothetical protein